MGSGERVQREVESVLFADEDKKVKERVLTPRMSSKMEEVDDPNPGVAVFLCGGGRCDAGCVFWREMRHFSDSVHWGVSPDFFGAKNQIFTEVSRPFYNRNCSAVFFLLWRLLQRLERKKGKEQEDEKKKETWQNRREGKIGKTKK